MLYFKTREAARAFAQKTNRRLTDLGSQAVRRWAVELVRFEA